MEVSPETIIAVICVLVIVVALLDRWYDRRANQRLMTSPPEQVMFEVSLAMGVDDANLRMARLLRNTSKLFASSWHSRHEGRNSLSVVQHISLGESEGGLPTLRTFVYCDPDIAETLKRRLKQEFGQSLFIAVPASDRMQELSELLCPSSSTTASR